MGNINLQDIANIASIGGTAYSVSEGERGKSEGRKAIRRQEDAQRDAQSSATAEARKASEATNRARRQRRNQASLLGDAQMDALGGTASTLLTEQTAASRDRLRLGRTSLLGG